MVINAPENSVTNKYIEDMKMNGKEYTKNFLNHIDLMKGAVLDFKMGAVPNEKRGINEEDFPYSFSKEK